MDIVGLIGINLGVGGVWNKKENIGEKWYFV